MIGVRAKILGAFVGSRSRAYDWLEAVNRAVCRQFPRGILEAKTLELNLMSENGSQPTSMAVMRECRWLGIKQTFPAYANPKGNADTERLIRTIKEELCSLREWSSVEELKIEMEKFVEYFNENYLHSALGYRTPNAFEAEWLKNNQITRSATASLTGCITQFERDFRLFSGLNYRLSSLLKDLNFHFDIIKFLFRCHMIIR
jgi:hypothetical protein